MYLFYKKEDSDQSDVHPYSTSGFLEFAVMIPGLKAVKRQLFLYDIANVQANCLLLFNKKILFSCRMAYVSRNLNDVSGISLSSLISK